MSGSATQSGDSDYYGRVISNTAAGRVISVHGHELLPEYLRSIIPTTRLSNNTAARLLVDELSVVARRHYGDVRIARAAVAEFRDRPVLQLADGADLLLDTETLINHLHFQIACRDAGIQHMWTQQCTTVRAIQATRPPRGPAMVHTDAGNFTLFQGSRKRLLHTNIACLSPVDVIWRSVDRTTPPTQLPPPFLQPFLHRRYSSAPEAILQINRHIWERLRIRDKKSLILFDEDFSADLVARHLELRAQPLTGILTEPEYMSTFLATKRDAIDSPNNIVLRDSTDMFWIRLGHRLQSARVWLRSAAKGELRAAHAPISVELTREVLIDQLRRRAIYPDLILTYLAIIVLPGVTAAGGASQQEYLPLIESITRRVHQQGVPIPSDVLERLTHSTHSVLIGPSLLELPSQYRRLLLTVDQDTGLDAIEDDLMRRSVRAAAGELTYLSYLDRLRAIRTVANRLMNGDDPPQ